MKFRQYVQGWREGDTPREYLEFTTKEELLSTATAKRYKDRPFFHRFSWETYNGLFHRLMAEFNDGCLWYVAGDIAGTSEEIANLGLPRWKSNIKEKLMQEDTIINTKRKVVEFGTPALAKYTPRNVIAKVVRNLPEGYGLLADALKALIEINPEIISGLESGFSIKKESNRLVVCHKASTPVLVLQELEGRAVENTCLAWMKHLTTVFTPNKPEVGTIDVLFFEPDSTGSEVVAAWLIKNARIEDFSGSEAGRNLDFMPRAVRYRLELRGSTERGERIDEMAREALKEMELVAANPFQKTDILVDANVTQ